MDKEVERLCKTCPGCQANSESSRPEPIAGSLPPSGLWQDSAIDILGPLPTGENIFVIVDYCSRYFEAVIMKTVTSAKIVKALEGIFGRLGLPYSLRSDNGSQFVPMLFRTSCVTTVSSIDELLHLGLGKMESASDRTVR